MQTAHQQTSTQVEWITKEAAAQLLGKAERTVLAMAAAGKIQSKREPDPDRRGQQTTLLHAGDVARLAHGVPLLDENGVSNQLARRPAATLPATLHDTVNPSSIPTPARSPRPWLTLDEAAEFSGLTKRWLLSLAEMEILVQEIPIRDMGKHSPGGRWRFHRDSLAKA